MKVIIEPYSNSLDIFIYPFINKPDRFYRHIIYADDICAECYADVDEWIDDEMRILEDTFRCRKFPLYLLDAYADDIECALRIFGTKKFKC